MTSVRPFVQSYPLGLWLQHTQHLGYILPGIYNLLYVIPLLQLTQSCSDVAYDSYKTHRRGPSPIEAVNFSEPTRVGIAAVQRATFQSIASMQVNFTYLLRETCWSLYRALPAFTIHTAVAQSRKVFRNAINPKVKTWGPTVTGLAIVPVLPYLFDHPVEHVTDRVFDWIRIKLIENNTTKSNAERKEL